MKDIDYFPVTAAMAKQRARGQINQTGAFLPNVLVFFGHPDDLHYVQVSVALPDGPPVDAVLMPTEIGKVVAARALEGCTSQSMTTLGPPRVVCLTTSLGLDGPDKVVIVLAALDREYYEIHGVRIVNDRGEWRMVGDFVGPASYKPQGEFILPPVLKALRPLRRAADN